jgi:NnrU protein
MLPLVLAAICFAGIHLGIAGTTLRDRVVAVLGEGAHGAVFVAIAWLVMAYRSAPYVMSTRASPQGKPRTGVKPSPFASGCGAHDLGNAHLIVAVHRDRSTKPAQAMPRFQVKLS